MSQTKEDPLIRKRDSQQKEEEKTTKSKQNTADISRSEDKKPTERPQQTSGFKLGWVVFGSIIVLIITILYTRQVEKAVHQKQEHFTRDTEQIQVHEPEITHSDNQFTLLHELWKRNYVLEREGSSLTVKCLRCSESGDQATDETLPKLVKDIAHHMQVTNLTLSSPWCRDFTNRGFISFSDSLAQHLKNLEGISLSFSEPTNITDESLVHFFTTVGNTLKRLKQFSLNIAWWNNGLTPQSIEQLALSLDHYPRSLQNFSITLLMWKDLKDETGKNLLVSLGKNFPGLQNLELKFRGCEKLTKGLAREMASMIGQNHKNLESLLIYFGGWSGIGNEDIKYISEDLAQNLKGLKKFSLNIAKTKVSNEGIGYLSKTIGENLDNLEDLSLDFHGCSGIYDFGLEELANNFKSKFPKLRRLFLGFLGLEQITDVGVQHLSSIFNENHRKIEDLSLDLALSAKITDQGLISLSSSIGQHLDHLQKLFLYFATNSKVTDEGYKHLGGMFNRNLHTLRDLSILIRGTNSATEEGLKQLFNPIGENLNNLEKLRFECHLCENFKDESAAIVASAVHKRLHKLGELTLLFMDTKIGNAGVDAIAESLSQFRQDLRILSISLESMSATDPAVMQLINSIGKHLRSLEKLTFSFVMSSQLTDQTVSNVGRMVTQDLVHLQELYLKFGMCPRITHHPFKKLAADVAEKLPNLYKLYMNLPKRLPDSPEKKAFQKELSIFPSPPIA